MTLELRGDPVSKRYRAARAAAFRRAQLATAEAAPHPNDRDGPVDVSPAQRQQLALTEPRHRRGQVEDPLELAEMVVGHSPHDRLHLLDLEIANVGARAGLWRAIDRKHWVSG